MDDHRNNRRGASTAILLLIAAFSLLLTFAFLAPRPDAVAMQVGQTVGSTPSLTVIFPLQPPPTTGVPTATRRPTQTPQSLIWITDPTEAWVLINRAGSSDPSGVTGPTAAPAATQVPDSLVRSVNSGLRFYLPLVNTHWTTWAKGAGKHVPTTASPTLILPTPGPNVAPLKLNWYYNWGYKTTETPSPFESKSFVPMVWCVGKASDGVGANHIDAAKLQQLATAYPGRLWLVFNEPDFPAAVNQNGVYSFQQCAKWVCKIVQEQNPQENYPCVWGGNSGTPTPNPTVQVTLQAKMAELTADRFAEVSDILKTVDPTARVYCCGNFFAYNTNWWTDFKNHLRTQHSDVKIDGVAIHAYPWTRSTLCLGGAANIWVLCLESKLEGFRSTHEGELIRPDSVLVPDAPLWITEYGYLLYTGPTATPGTPTASQVVDTLMNPLVDWLQTGQSGYQAVAWYVTIDQDSGTAAETNLFYVTQSGIYSLTTPVGTTWAGVVPITATPDR